MVTRVSQKQLFKLGDGGKLAFLERWYVSTPFSIYKKEYFDFQISGNSRKGNDKKARALEKDKS